MLGDEVHVNWVDVGKDDDAFNSVPGYFAYHRELSSSLDSYSCCFGIFLSSFLPFSYYFWVSRVVKVPFETFLHSEFVVVMDDKC